MMRQAQNVANYALLSYMFSIMSARDGVKMLLAHPKQQIEMGQNIPRCVNKYLNKKEIIGRYDDLIQRSVENSS